jgi:hemerythrin-like domain-containing protein
MSYRDSMNFKGSKATQLLRDQHYTTVGVTEDFLDNKIDITKLLKHIDYTIKVHFSLEDVILIPAFSPFLRKYMVFEEPIRIISGEHASVKSIFNGINKPRIYEGEQDITLTQEEIIGKGGQIAKIMLQHVYKEENGLFNLVEQYLPEPEKNRVGNELSMRYTTLDNEYNTQSKK